MTWGRYSSQPDNKPLTPLQLTQSAVFAPAVLNAIQDSRLRGYLVDKSVPWDAVDLPLVTDLPRAPKDRAEVNYLIDETNEVVVRMFYRAATGNWVQVGAYPVVGSLPAVTTEGFQVIYDTGTAGVRWQFVYDSSDGTTYPWMFIGGPPLVAEVTTSQTTTSTSFAALATAGPSVTIPLVGDYDVSIGCKANNNTDGNGAMMSYDIGGTGAVDADSIEIFQSGATSVTATNYRTRRKAGLTLVSLTSKYRATVGGTATFWDRSISALPVRVG